MDSKNSFETIIGGIVLFLCVLFFVHIVKTNNNEKKETYKDVLYAKFSNIDGIKVGSEVKIAGVRVGFVKDIKLDNNSFNVKVKINVIENLNLPIDSVIAVVSSGILGGKFLSIKPGVEDTFLANNSTFSIAQSTMNLEDLIGKVVASFGNK